MENISIVLIVLAVAASIILLVLWIMLPIIIYRISGKMDRIIGQLDYLINRLK